MKQVVQNFRTGHLRLEEVPEPQLRPGGLLVRTAVSAVSAGTEKSKIDLARKNLLAKARARPDQVKKLLDTVRKEGVRATFDKVRNKLDALSPLGYSAVGRVLAVGAGCENFSVGDRVACAGAGFANHAELLWVPSNLCARVPSTVRDEDAAFTTIGAIALQGIRQAEAKFGEAIAVIGLGLLGQLTCQLLRAAGCRVVGIDVDPWKVQLAREQHVDLVSTREDDVVEKTLAFTEGLGADSIIITAAAQSNDPFLLAGAIARDRAHVVLVGAVPIDLPRSPYYEKELDIRLSRSYGPGRYDVAYEEKGIDYPPGYVRWTENRNMSAFLAALAKNQVSLTRLITHRIPLEEAVRAYDLISGTTDERYLGIVLTYDASETSQDAERHVERVVPSRGEVRLSFIGAGSFAGSTLIPILKQTPGVVLRAVCTASGMTAKDIAARHGFASAMRSASEVLNDDACNAVVIASRHDTHAELAAEALEAGKAVFVEKPLALTRDQLARIAEALHRNPRLTVGFNRRFSPHTARVMTAFGRDRGALVIQVRVNAGAIPASSWIHDPAIGGGRILGEACHFVDLAQALAGSRIRRVFCSAVGLPDSAAKLRDNAIISLDFENGSIASIIYTSKGDAALGKERIEVFGGGMSAVIDDFTVTTIMRGGKRAQLKTSQDKGHREELRIFVGMVERGDAPPIPIDELLNSSVACIAAIESLSVGQPIDV